MTSKAKASLRRRALRMARRHLNRLGLGNWKVVVSVVKDATLAREHGKPVQGDAEQDVARRRARIRISEEWNYQDKYFGRTLPEFMAHEVWHVWVAASSLDLKGRMDAEEYLCDALAPLLSGIRR